MNACCGAPVLILAQAQRAPSMAEWAVSSLGFIGLLVLLSGLVIFAGAIFVVARSHRPTVIAAYRFFVPLPLMLAVFDLVKGFVACFSVLALSDVALKQSEINAGIAEQLLVLSSGLLATIPSYLVVAIGLFVRMLLANDRSTSRP